MITNDAPIVTAALLTAPSVCCSKQPDLHVFKEFTKRSRLAVVVDAFLAGYPRTTVLKRSKDKARRSIALLTAFADNMVMISPRANTYDKATLTASARLVDWILRSFFC